MAQQAGHEGLRRRTGVVSCALMGANRRHHSVYVVYLRNPKGDGKAGYYVGMTGLTPERRFENHKAGLRASRIVKRFELERRKSSRQAHSTSAKKRRRSSMSCPR